jgi:hypothetical protein
MSTPQTKREMGLEIADCGRWEEFHQKRGEYCMYDFYKERRLALQKKYNAMPNDKGMGQS